MSLNLSEIDAMIRLLDDTDPEVYSHIEGQLIKYGKDVIPFLENAWGNAFNATLQQRIEFIIHKIQFDGIKAELKKWVAEGGKDLLEGAILIARYQYPDLDETKIQSQVDKIRRDAWLELHDNLTALEKARVLSHVIFEIHNFGGNTTNFHAPQNSYINNVLESKKGNPLILGLIYTVVAQKLEVPIYGVNLPEHFVLAYMNEHFPEEGMIPPADTEVLFYINPFSKGTVFHRREIDTFLKQLKIPAEPAFYTACTNTDMVKRLVRNLIFAYQKQGFEEKTAELEILAKVFE